MKLIKFTDGTVYSRDDNGTMRRVPPKDRKARYEFTNWRRARRIRTSPNPRGLYMKWLEEGKPAA